MRSINTVDDLKCFQGCIVVFTINSCYSDHIFSLPDNTELKYGTIYPIEYDVILDENVHVLQNFVFYNRRGNKYSLVLSSETLSRYKITMRAATLDEIEIIRNAIVNNQACNFISHRGNRTINWDLYMENTKRFVDV